MAIIPEETIIEWCTHCGYTVELKWDIEADGMGIYCPFCGKEVILCTECPDCKEKDCDWTINGGCRHHKYGNKNRNLRGNQT